MAAKIRKIDPNGQTDGAKNLPRILRRHLGQRTVLGIAIPVLDDYLIAAKTGEETGGITERQVEDGFRQLSTQFLHSDYHPTYIARRLGRMGFLDFTNGKYRLRPSLLIGTTVDELDRLRDELTGSLRSAYEQRQATIKKLEETCALPPDRVGERHVLVEEYLSQIAGSHGEVFEVISFAVLREYFRTFGFSLHRFSTTHANDGGMDFFAADAIYQVTTNESIEKLRRDLRKAPGTKRVLVRPTVNEEITQLDKDKVLETIELKDLLNHFITWLLGRDKRSKQSNHLQRVLQIALEEFRRENKAEFADRPNLILQ
ncbi:MAG: hypothetical protein ACRD3N_16165 [Terracidiphilus sp.]